MSRVVLVSDPAWFKSGGSCWYVSLFVQLVLYRPHDAGNTHKAEASSGLQLFHPSSRQPTITQSLSVSISLFLSLPRSCATFTYSPWFQWLCADFFSLSLALSLTISRLCASISLSILPLIFLSRYIHIYSIFSTNSSHFFSLMHSDFRLGCGHLVYLSSLIVWLFAYLHLKPIVTIHVKTQNIL